VEIADETPKKALSGAFFWMTTADSMRCFNQPSLTLSRLSRQCTINSARGLLKHIGIEEKI
jgi:hypothetical protein